MDLQYGTSAFERARGNLPDLPCDNMFAEESPTESSAVLQSRPGLVAGADLGAAVDALFQKDGVLAQAQFAVAGVDLYRNGTLVGGLDGTGPFSIAGYGNRIFIAGGASLWTYDGEVLERVAFPDEAAVAKVLTGSSRLIALRADTQQYYWSDVLGDTIDALSFASAESQPDRLRDAIFIDDTLILFGAETVEFHPNTTDADLPFQPLEGRVFEAGIRNAGAVTALGASFAWVTESHHVCISSPDAIASNEGLEALIQASGECRLWTFFIDTTEFLALRIDAGTWARSQRTGTWHKMTSYGAANWLPQCHAAGVFGCSDGRLATFGTGHQDFNGVLERRFRAGSPIDSSGIHASNVMLRTNPGQTPFLAGDYRNPSVEMRTSRDGGQTWGVWRAATLGQQGDYRKKVQWLANGMFGHPGILCEFRVTDPVPWRVSGVRVNEPYGGI